MVLLRPSRHGFLNSFMPHCGHWFGFSRPTSSDAIGQSAAWPKITAVSSWQGGAVLPRARKYEPTTTPAASDWAVRVSTVGKIENHNPIHVGIRGVNALIGVVGIQCASCIS